MKPGVGDDGKLESTSTEFQREEEWKLFSLGAYYRIGIGYLIHSIKTNKNIASSN